jgi:flagellar protein FlaG
MDINTTVAPELIRTVEETSVQVKQRQKAAQVVEEMRANAAESRTVMTEFAEKLQVENKQNAAASTDAEDQRELERASAQVESTLSAYTNRVMEISIDEETGKRVIRLTDRETGELIRQIPQQEYLDMVAALNKIAQVLIKDLPKYI